MDWKEKNVLITGANGFVGSWLSQELSNKGANIIAVVRDDIPNSTLSYMNVYPKLKAVAKGDITEYSFVKRVFNEYEIDTCFHLAAQTIVTVANRSPLPTFETNIKGTWNILDVALKSKTIERVVIASTDKVYGKATKLPITEENPLLGIFPYDVSKVCAEKLADSYFVTYGLPIGITRCCNIYGGGDLNFSRIVPDTIRSIIRKRDPIIRSDGTPVRDYIYVADAVGGYMSLAENIEKKGVKGEAFNFGSNSPISVLAIVKKIIEVSGSRVKSKILGKGKPIGEIDVQYLSSKKAERLLNWKPKVTLEDGLKETIKWYTNFFSSQH